jgi:hypothetical protein
VHGVARTSPSSLGQPVICLKVQTRNHLCIPFFKINIPIDNFTDTRKLVTTRPTLVAVLPLSIEREFQISMAETGIILSTATPFNGNWE